MQILVLYLLFLVVEDCFKTSFPPFSLFKELMKEIMQLLLCNAQGSWSGSSHSHSAVKKALDAQAKPADWEIDRRLLKIGERIASGSCGDL